ncbi:PREDICTED: aquaporin-4-like [Bactrocera latifrons]|uniref:aquaporin-4-like n=1 Tax=Bactrocera latifrons TaxID=174628 RepID=UPI0008DCF2A5|nr:PREDICTED: aquaporin-4-like [Bactrocera latifrons]
MKFNKLFFVQIFGEFCAASMWMQLHCYGIDPLVAEGGVMSYGLCDGCALMIIIQTFGCVSGAYMNPCLTVAGVIMGKLKWDLAIFYVIMQYLDLYTRRLPFGIPHDFSMGVGSVLCLG